MHEHPPVHMKWSIIRRNNMTSECYQPAPKPMTAWFKYINVCLMPATFLYGTSQIIHTVLLVIDRSTSSGENEKILTCIRMGVINQFYVDVKENMALKCKQNIISFVIWRCWFINNDIIQQYLREKNLFYLYFMHEYTKSYWKLAYLLKTNLVYARTCRNWG